MENHCHDPEPLGYEKQLETRIHVFQQQLEECVNLYRAKADSIQHDDPRKSDMYRWTAEVFYKVSEMHANIFNEVIQ